MFIFKSLFAIALILLMGACASESDHGTYYDVLIDSYATKPMQKGETFYVSPGTEGLATDQLRFDTIAQVLNKALTNEGLTQVQNPSQADLQIALFYEIKKESDIDDFQVPVYSTGIPGSLNPGRTIHTGLQRALIPVVMPKYIRYVVVTAINKKQRKVVWETTIMSRGDSDELMRVSPVLIASGMNYYGRPSGGKISKTVWDSNSSIRSLISP